MLGFRKRKINCCAALEKSNPSVSQVTEKRTIILRATLRVGQGTGKITFSITVDTK